MPLSERECNESYNKQILLFVKLNPETVKLESGFTRDMCNIGHYDTGDLQITIKNASDFERAKPLLERTYFYKQRNSMFYG